MEDRRTDLRSRVSWPVRLWLGEGVFALVRAVDASPTGMRLAVSPRVRKMIRLHDSYKVEFGTDARPIECLAEVRYCDSASIGVVFSERLATLQGFASETPPESVGTARR